MCEARIAVCGRKLGTNRKTGRTSCDHFEIHEILLKRSEEDVGW